MYITTMHQYQQQCWLQLLLCVDVYLYVVIGLHLQVVALDACLVQCSGVVGHEHLPMFMRMTTRRTS